MNSQLQINKNYNLVNTNNSNNNHFPSINQKYSNDNKCYNKDSPPPASRMYKKSGSKAILFLMI